ncbi:M16 family metallopeptidase [Comamonas endophytica]|uniref:Insulinase family protein n=1 Tax=Comamonas endophytica TaxID=2949090 RepID=A0ABY6G738_9BURK|nr:MULTISPECIES: pitrilysin family protein [unclassified Acidovorax]MCD2511329.1 insulinase family protein [Acidovorax sp. D4N7]UYG50723.1 insulinase family protein [Acidovorax sp. 5MLIR]
MKVFSARTASCLLALTGGLLASPAWALLPIQHWTQPSGAKVWLVDSPGIPMVDVQVAFDAGSRRDPAEQAGLASAVALMASKGVSASGNAPAQDENALGEAWADLGASFGAGADDDGFSYSLRSLTDPALLTRAAQLAARQIAEPSWQEDIWLRERARWSAAIKESDTQPGTVAAKAFSAAVYGGHPYGQQSSAATLERIDVSAMQSFHRRLINACSARVSIVGALDREQADQLVQQLLAPLQARDAASRPAGSACPQQPALPEVPALAEARNLDIPFASAQAHVLIGQPGITRRNPDFLAVMVGNHILGGGGFTSRLMEQVREKRGLSYSVSSSFAPGLHAGAFVIGLQTRSDQAPEAIKVSQQVLADFVARGPTEAELREAKDNLIGGFALRIDSNRKLLANVANIAWNDLPLDYLEHWTKRVEALTADEVRAAMARMLQPERMVTLSVGARKP